MSKLPCAAKYTGMILIAGLLNACSTGSVLIRQDDQTFAMAQQRLQRTEETVDELKPDPSERALFMQAESFYRYRFSPPQRSAEKYLTEAAAAITDFPGFQSLAGSLDLQDMRFRGPDSAVQLWETLLELHPHTKLRSLTLYRLGWAYRSVGVQGLPRSSPDDAFNELIRENPDSSLAKLAQDAKFVSWKSKETAAFRSLIPGLGQMYLGETGSGLTRLAIAIAALFAVVTPVYSAARGHRVSPISTAAGVGGLIVLTFDFTTSYENALHGVVLWNERAEAEFNIANPAAP
ncbi:MAG: hypothetical protein M0042_12160 [Nitrospiraceae bacterium]|nr:hypothetical protein [Nitrospiraceae bacterium]